MKPASVNSKKKEEYLLKTVYNKPKVFLGGKYKVGDLVRIADPRGIFEKSFHANFSSAIFKIVKVQITDPVTYKVQHTTTNEILDKAFYEPELVKVKHGEVYLISKVLKRKKNKLFVNFLGFKKNVWIDVKDLV